MNRYTDKIMRNFLNPKNAGAITGANAVTKIKGTSVAGDIIKFYFSVNEETEVIENVKFKTRGCTVAIAASNIACDMLKDKTLAEAAEIKDSDIVENLGDVPLDKLHCAVTVEEAIKNTINDYYVRQEKEKKRLEKAFLKQNS